METGLKNRANPDDDTQHGQAPDQSSYDREFGDIVKHYGETGKHPLGKEEAKAAQSPAGSGKDDNGTLSPQKLQNAEKNPAGGSPYKHSNDAAGDSPWRQRLKQFAKKRGGWSLAALLVPLIIGMLGIGSFSNLFRLDHLLSNIEKKGFIRYQVDMDGRSSKWIAAYLALRMGEVESELAPADRDNILFRSNVISADNPVLAWYKLMRGTKKVAQFEEDLLRQHGIKFTSIACQGEIRGNECIPGGTVTRFRQALITIRDEQIPLEMTEAEKAAWARGDVNGFNNRLRQFIDVEIFQSDKVARKQLIQAIKDNTKFYQVIKRWILRIAIMNMTGMRDWRFFDKTFCLSMGGKVVTKDECAEQKRSIRNKVIIKMLPESVKGGRIIQCIFGITSCKKTTTDPNNPENRSPLAPLPIDCSTSNDPKCKTSVTDAEGNSHTKSNTAADGLSDGIETDSTDLTGSFTKKLVLQVVQKAKGPLALVDIVDTLNYVDGLVKSGALSNLVYVSRMQQAIGTYAVMGIMRDQIKADEDITAEEVDAVMDIFDNAGASEGWVTVVEPSSARVASAAPLEPYKTREEYCSPEYQEKMLQAQNWQVANSIDHLLCPSEKIGGDNLAKDIENGWNSSVGVVLGPILLVYNGSGLSTVVGWFNQAVGAILNATVTPIIQGILSAAGLSDNIEDFIGWLATKTASILGAGPAMSEQAPAGVWVNHVIMGAAAASETAARNQGAALTDDASRDRMNQTVAAFMNNERASSSIFERYLALSNPHSLASNTLFAVTDGGMHSGLQKTFGSAFKSVLNGSVLIGGVRAATNDEYAAAKFAGLETYDFPATCINQHPFDMTPLSSTNADELGLIPAGELTWELVGTSDKFYDRLYQDENIDGEKIKRVYNCALLDSSIRGGLGGLYNTKTLDANTYGYGARN